MFTLCLKCLGYSSFYNQQDEEAQYAMSRALVINAPTKLQLQ